MYLYDMLLYNLDNKHPFIVIGTVIVILLQ